jgi:hypothetical protein
MNWLGVHVLTPASTVFKHTVDGKPSEDSATRAWDADPQQASVLDTTKRVNRLLVKTRRD